MACLTPLEIEKRLADKGIAATVQRISICRYVLCEADHPTADDVYAWALKALPKISLATVYNTLGLLVKAELLKEYRFPFSEKVIYDNNLDVHHHFYDSESGRLHDISAEDIEITIKGNKSLKVNSAEVFLKGEIHERTNSTNKNAGNR